MTTRSQRRSAHSFRWLYTTLILGLSFTAPTGHARAADLKLDWTNNVLTVSSPSLPGGKVEIWYLEAFCRHGSTHQDWGRTTIPHRTELLSRGAGQQSLRLRTRVEPAVEVLHEVRAGTD